MWNTIFSKVFIKQANKVAFLSKATLSCFKKKSTSFNIQFLQHLLNLGMKEVKASNMI